MPAPNCFALAHFVAVDIWLISLDSITAIQSPTVAIRYIIVSGRGGGKTERRMDVRRRLLRGSVPEA
jgi:hypothetical protein